MKKLFTLLFVIAGLNAWSQVSFDKDTTYGEGAFTEFEIPVKVQLTNSSNDTTFKIIRYTYDNCSFDGGSAFCDQRLCYPATTDTADVVISKDESFEMKVNFYPGNVAGCCQVKIYVVSTTNSSNIDSCVFNASTTGFNCKIGIRNIATNVYRKSQVYPNPTTGTIQLETANKKPFTVIIYDMLGNEALRINQVLNNKSISVKDLPSGIYIMKVVGEFNSTSKFRKL